METGYWLGSLLASDVAIGVVSWLLAKRKYNAEVDNNIIENMQKSLDFYKQLSDDTKERLETVLKENSELRSEVKELRAIVDKLTTSLANYGINRLLEDADASFNEEAKPDNQPVNKPRNAKESTIKDKGSETKKAD